MPYLNEAGLSRYSDKLKEWIGAQPGKTLPPSLYPWTLSEKAGAVTCWPVGGTELRPTVDFMFTETGPANGDKGPENPSTITGVTQASVGRVGKNLLFPEDIACVPGRGITATINQDGSVSVSGTTNGNGILYFRYGGTTTENTIKNSPFFAGLTYTVSMECPDSKVVGYVHHSVNGGITWSSSTTSFTGGQSRTFTVPAGTTGLQIWTQTTAGITLNTTVKMLCELGETATAFEKGVKDTYTIPLNGTFYGGSIDLATGVMTVTHWADTITSANGLNRENTNTVGVSALLSKVGEIDNNANNLICDAFPFAGNQSDSEHIRFQAGGDAIVIYIAKSRLEYVDNWVDSATAWLTQNPITVVYKLATTFTLQLTPTEVLSLTQPDKYTPRINTVYSDQTSVQVGYPKSPLATATELTNAIISLGGNV